MTHYRTYIHLIVGQLFSVPYINSDSPASLCFPWIHFAIPMFGHAVPQLSLNTFGRPTGVYDRKFEDRSDRFEMPLVLVCGKEGPWDVPLWGHCIKRQRPGMPYYSR